MPDLAEPVYFDYNATSPVCPPARQVLASACEEAWYNPSSPYSQAARVANRIGHVREWFADRLKGETPEQVVFTSGATEANNAVIRYAAGLMQPSQCLLLSPVEHPSLWDAAHALLPPSQLVHAPLREDGNLDLDGLQTQLREQRIGFCSMMAANNETGIEYPIGAVAELCRQAGVWFHCDASQWAGKRDLELVSGADFLTLSAHKFLGPKGVGVLKLPNRLEAEFRMSIGGAQENDHRAGTENVPAVLAMKAALEETEKVLEKTSAEQHAFGRDAFEDMLGRHIPDVRILGKSTQRLWNTSYVLMPRHDNVRWVAALDKLGYQVSTGSACATGKEGPSHVLHAHGIDSMDMRRVLRFSGGWHTRHSQWQSLADACLQALEQMDRKQNTASHGRVIEL